MNEGHNGRGAKDYRVYLNLETKTHMVVWRSIKVEGYDPVYGPDTFLSCMQWVQEQEVGQTESPPSH
jgi:hypothetical protein